METIADLRRKINTAIYNIKTQIPAKVAESMDRETRLNFEREEYGNDGTPRKWADRWGKNFKTKNSRTSRHTSVTPSSDTRDVWRGA